MLLSALALTACSDDNYGDPARDLDGTTYFIPVHDENGFQTFYMPQVGTVGDPMPFYDPKAGDFKIMYLQEFPSIMKTPGRYHPYWTVSTNNGASYTSLGEWLSIGTYDTQQDAILGTGCCIYDEASALYYIYYTGESEKTPNRQVVMRATSNDLKTWTRDNLWRLQGPDFNLSGEDFRDPQILKVGDKYHMIVSTRNLTDADAMFAEFTSDNLKDWTYVDKFHMLWNRMYECPDIFQMGDWWYLVYSDTPAWERTIKYVKAKSYEELKAQFTNNDDFDHKQAFMKLDTRALYAGKTASNGTDRYLWGWCSWNPMLGSDGEEPAWSGALVCHKVAQHEDGSLYLTAVPAMASKYNKPAQVKVMKTGETKDENGKVCESYTLYNRLGAHNHITLTVKTQNSEDHFGLTFARGTDSEEWDKIWFNNPHWDGDKKHLRRIERYLSNGVDNTFMPGGAGNFFPAAANNTYNIDIYTDNSVFVMYVNGTNCYTTRVYDLPNNCWGISTDPGVNIEVSNVAVNQY